MYIIRGEEIYKGERHRESKERDSADSCGQCTVGSSVTESAPRSLRCTSDSSHATRARLAPYQVFTSHCADRSLRCSTRRACSMGSACLCQHLPSSWAYA